MGTYYRIRITCNTDDTDVIGAIRTWANENIKKHCIGTVFSINDFWGKWSSDEWSWDPTSLMHAVSEQFPKVTFSLETCGEWNSHVLFNSGVELTPKEVGFKRNFGDPTMVSSAVKAALGDRHKVFNRNEKIKKKIAALEKEADALKDQLV